MLFAYPLCGKPFVYAGSANSCNAQQRHPRREQTVVPSRSHPLLVDGLYVDERYTAKLLV